MITNNTGIPLQLMQLHRGGYTQSIAGVTPNPATLSGLPRAAVPPAGSGRDGSAQGAPGLRSTVASPDADVTSTLDLPTGADSPVHPTCTYHPVEQARLISCWPVPVCRNGAIQQEFSVLFE